MISAKRSPHHPGFFELHREGDWAVHLTTEEAVALIDALLDDAEVAELASSRPLHVRAEDEGEP